MRNKKIVIPALVGVVVFALGAAYIPVSRAATDLPLFGATTVLGISVLTGNSGSANSVMTYIDFSSAPETDQNYTLPSVNGKAGQMIIVKPAGAVVGEDGTFLNVYPASGDLLDNNPNKEYHSVAAWGMVGAVIFVADPANDTWWIVSTS